MISTMGARVPVWGHPEATKTMESIDIDPGIFQTNPFNSTDAPIPVEPDGGIGDGAGPIAGPMPVEPDGGIGDGAGPIAGPIPVEPDGGIGDGAGPIPLPFPTEGNSNSGNSADPVTGPIPVEPDGGIGDGAGPIAGPIPIEPDGGIGDGAGPIPMPVEPDGGIGDGAGPITNDNDGNGSTVSTFVGGGIGTKGDDTFISSEDSDVFIFLEDHGNDTILGFNADIDSLDFSDAEFDFTDLDSLLAHAEDVVDAGDTSTVTGIYITTGENSGVYIEGISTPDLASVDILF